MARCIWVIIGLAFYAVLSLHSYAGQSQHAVAHAHGISLLTVALEGEHLAIELRSPAMDIVGFEYTASSKEDIAAVEKASLTLNQHDNLFSLSGGGCTHVASQVDMGGITAFKPNDKSIHDHKHEHSHAHKTDSTYTASEHRDVVAHYTYRCDKSASLSTIRVLVFDAFAAMQKINAQWVKGSTQGAATLTPGAPVIFLK